MTRFIEKHGLQLEAIANGSCTDEGVYFDSAGCTYEDVVALVNALKGNMHIQEVYLSDNGIDDRGAVLLSTLGQPGVSGVKVLDLSENAISTSGARALFKSGFEVLHLSTNPIGNKSLEELKNNTTLIELDVSECGITDEGASAIFKNETLKILNLSLNIIKGESFKKLADNFKLQILRLDDNPIKKSYIRDLTENNSLKELALSQLGLGNVEACAIAQGKGLQSLERLDLSHNEIDYEGAEALLKRFNNVILFDNRINTDAALLHKKNLSSNKYQRIFTLGCTAK